MKILLFPLLFLFACTNVGWNPYLYIVKKGDNLYQIAWKYNTTVDSLIKNNNLQKNSILPIGMKLDIRGKWPSTKSSKAKKTYTASHYKHKATIAWRKPIDNLNVLHRFTGISPNDYTGIFITAIENTEISTAAPGTVAYQGDGIRAYGLLVIIKHSDNYLSAYGFLANSQVKEGQLLKAGDVIGESGTNLRGEKGFHLEIRRQGVPQNPTTFLGI